MTIASSISGGRKEFILIALCLVIVGMIFSGMRDRDPREDFVHLEDDGFVLNGEPFHPLVLNYIITLQTDGSDVWAAPYQGYTPGYRYEYIDRDSSLLLIHSDMELIRQMGFNAVRIVKLAEGPARNKAGEIFLNTFLGNEKDTLLSLADPSTRSHFLDAIGDVLRAARERDLKVILLTNMRPDEPAVTEHWRTIADRFKDEPAIMAYDLFNEPLYFDSLHRSKKEVHRIVKDWRKLMRDHAPDHLFTIGLQGIRETFEWDPNILDVDFISFHPYEYEPEQVRNEMRWYHEQVDVPWIIGETSLPADNDSVPYSDQLEFARKMLDQAMNCGACGSSWWHYKDVDWGDFHSNYMGLMDLNGRTHVEGAPLPIKGTPKPAVLAFQEFDPEVSKGECLRLPNYENYSGHTTSMITGRLLDDQGRPIEGGVVIGWNEHWTRSYHTVSKHDGTFFLRGDFYFYHWMATATRHTWVRGDVAPNSYLTLSHGIPEMYLGDLRVEHLSLHGPGGIFY